MFSSWGKGTLRILGPVCTRHQIPTRRPLAKPEIQPYSHSTERYYLSFTNASNLFRSQFIFQAMYIPAERLPKLAAILAGLEQSNTTAYAIAVTGGTIPASPCNYAPSTATRDVDTLKKCVDGAGEKRFRSISQFEDYVDVLTSQSEFFGEVWPNNANGVACRAFEVSPPETKKLKDTILDSRQTASRILFVTTEVDPVAPKRGANKMSSVFPGSAVLIQHSVGHTAFLRLSICFARRIRDYLLSGQLPPPNSTCQADAEPFW